MTKPIVLNSLNINQRRILQFGIVFLLVVFFGILFFLMRGNASRVSSGVVLENSKLQVFDQIYDHFDYPNRLQVHYPYLLVIEPGKTLTTAYNLEKKEKVAEFKQVLLDFDGKNTLYNGKETFFNKTGLGILCEYGFIKSDQEILCVTKKNSATFENELMSINIKTKLQRILYEASDLITNVSFINGKLYIGEVDTDKNINYLIVNDKKIKVSTPVNLIYPMGEQIYLGSYKSVFTGHKQMYSELQGTSTKKQSETEIIISQ